MQEPTESFGEVRVVLRPDARGATDVELAPVAIREKAPGVFHRIVTSVESYDVVVSPSRLTQLVREYVNAADTGKKGACHLFRHTMATVMLENGADIRYIQEMLGHVELSTTQIYTQVSIKKLQAVHARTHPTAKLGRHEQQRPALVKASGTIDELFSRLAAEDDALGEQEHAAAEGTEVAPPAQRSRSGQRLA